MSRLRAVRTIFGVIAPAVHRIAATEFDEMIDEALDGAVSAWRSDNWTRFSDHEADCTVQMHSRLEDVVWASPSLRLLSPRLEWVQVTPAMRAGTESAATAGRPDIRLYVGPRRGFTMECKRLSLGGGRPRLYVNEGIARFVSGEYARDETRGGMIAYVQGDVPDEIVAAVNVAVLAHQLMGPGHELQRTAALAAIADRYASRHARQSILPIMLLHYLIDLR